MKVLVCWPPHIPSYFNAGHHLPVFTISAYLRAAGHDTDAIDGGALNLGWKEFGDQLFRRDYDVVILFNDFDVVEGIRRAAEYARSILPGATVGTVGRLSYQNPGFFRGMDLDAVGEGGDYECFADEVIRWAGAGRPAGQALRGASVRAGNRWLGPSGPGAVLDPESWVLPDPAEIPYDSYDLMYRRDQNKYCGIPQRRELVVPVARGCPVGCSFCDVPAMQGTRERRLGVPRVIEYIRQNFAERPFEYVAFYAPTFTLRKPWVYALCDGLRKEPRRYPWKCATTLYHLDQTLVTAMAEAGCVRISVGVETFEPEAGGSLPRIKRSAETRFDDVARWCREAGIELNCFVIVGLPRTSAAGTKRTLQKIRASGCRTRPTVYTSYQDMHADMTEQEVSRFNRQLQIDALDMSSAERKELMAIIFGDDGYTTPATERIPAAGEIPVAVAAAAVSGDTPGNLAR